MICFNEVDDYYICNNSLCKQLICKECKINIRREINISAVHNLDAIKCPFCTQPFNLYLKISNNVYIVRGFDSKNELFKLERNGEISYATYGCPVRFEYLPTLEYPTIFKEDLDYIYKRIGLELFKSEDNTERMILC
jgi:hypothetical protein